MGLNLEFVWLLVVDGMNGWWESLMLVFDVWIVMFDGWFDWVVVGGGIIGLCVVCWFVELVFGVLIVFVEVDWIGCMMFGCNFGFFVDLLYDISSESYLCSIDEDCVDVWF